MRKHLVSTGIKLMNIYHKALKEKCLNSSLKNTKVWKRNVFSSVREQTLKAQTSFEAELNIELAQNLSTLY